MKNLNLEDEIKLLKDKINQNSQNQNKEIESIKDEAEKYKKDCLKFKNKIENLEKENSKLNEDLAKAKKIIGGIKNNNIENNEIKKLRDEISLLRYQLNLKDTEIIDLKAKLLNNPKEGPKFNLNEVMIVYFKPIDNSFNIAINCVLSETFAEFEERLCKKRNELRNTNNMFTANTLPVLRFKTIGENHIHDGDVIQLIKLE